MTLTTQPPQHESVSHDDWTSWQRRPDLALLLFDRGITDDEIHRHITERLADPAAQPSAACLLCIAGVALGHWPSPDPTSEELNQ